MRSPQLMHSPRLMRNLQLMRSPQLMRSLQLVPKLHLAPRLTPRALRRRKPLEVKNSLVSSELTVRHGVRPLDL